MREAQTKLTDCTDKLTLQGSRVKELEIEKDMLLGRQRDAIRATDQDQMQIVTELDKLRSEFARLKV